MSFDNYTINPVLPSIVKSRNDVHLDYKLGPLFFDVPVIAAPMLDVCNGEMAEALAFRGAASLIHRFQDIEDQVNQLKYAHNEFSGSRSELIGCAVGINGDFERRFPVLYDNGCRLFCIDTANGFSQLLEPIFEFFKKHNEFNKEELFIITGNVANQEGFRFLSNLYNEAEIYGAVRCGIAGGSACATRTETGVYRPLPTTIMDISEIATRMSVIKKYVPYIIADGGIRNPADIAKAIIMGAHLVMCGSLLAGTKESPGSVIKTSDGLAKLYRGSASYGVQKEADPEKVITYNEGFEKFVPYKGSVIDVIDRIKGGLKSTVSYCGTDSLYSLIGKHDLFIERVHTVYA